MVTVMMRLEETPIFAGRFEQELGTIASEMRLLVDVRKVVMPSITVRL